MKTLHIPILSLALLVIASATAQAGQFANAKVVSVIGTVAKYSPDGSNRPLKVGELLKEGDSISVTALSEAKLVFSNGSELTIEENTSINITKLQQEPFSGGMSYQQLQADPSKSQTLLSLNYGKLSGHVKKLKPNSSFNIETPLGTAAIRGTIWSALLIYDAERGEIVLSVKNFDGLVDIISRYIGQIEYGKGNIGEKPYNSGMTETVKDLIPKNHTILIRLSEGDPYFDDLLNLIKNYVPTGPKPVITPSGNDDDFGIIVVSPEGPTNP